MVENISHLRTTAGESSMWFGRRVTLQDLSDLPRLKFEQSFGRGSGNARRALPFRTVPELLIYDIRSDLKTAHLKIYDF